VLRDEKAKLRAGPYECLHIIRPRALGGIRMAQNVVSGQGLLGGSSGRREEGRDEEWPMARPPDHPLKFYEHVLMLWGFGLTAGMIAKARNRCERQKSTGRWTPAKVRGILQTAESLAVRGKIRWRGAWNDIERDLEP
jgi:hypothetical protein